MPDIEPNPNPDSARADAVNPARRRLLKGGAAATPVLWAVTTRPARAATTECQAASVYGSMNTSNPNRQVQLCSGRLPTFWEDPVNFAKWPPPYYPTTSKEVGGVVASAFHDTGCSGGAFGNRTMVEVLSMSGQGGYADLGAHVVAALLNAASDLTPVLSVSQVLDLWNECSSRGYYEPTAGVQWGPDQLVAYLQSTMPG